MHFLAGRKSAFDETVACQIAIVSGLCYSLRQNPRLRFDFSLHANDKLRFLIVLPLILFSVEAVKNRREASVVHLMWDR